MRCNSCGEGQAVYHLHTNINGTQRELHLCSQCAKKLGMSGVPMFSGQMFENAASLFSGNGYKTDGVKTNRCPVCGASAEEISKTGYVGCAQCYKTFADLLGGYISKLHGGARHRGRVPKGFMSENYDRRMKEEKLSSLKKSLDEAVRVENYELAAKLKKEINALSEGQQQ